MSCRYLMRYSQKVKFQAPIRILFLAAVLFIVGISILWSYSDSNLSSIRLFGLKHGKPLVSKCSLRAELRGYHQKVVTYSLFGSFRDNAIFERYAKPLVDVAQTFPSKYPEWTMRIYHNVSLNDTENFRVLNEYFGDSSAVSQHVDLCFIGDIDEANANSPLTPRTWRFLALLDEQVDIFASRDSDSYVTGREIDAVREWLESNYTFHVMRDHPYHCTAILAGMWGAKIDKHRGEIRQAALKMFTLPHLQHKQFDQDILRDIMWPLMTQTSLMTHDSYCCQHFSLTGTESIMKPFPKQRIGEEFVGRVEHLWEGPGPQWLGNECPGQCRPRETMISLESVKSRLSVERIK